MFGYSDLPVGTQSLRPPSGCLGPRKVTTLCHRIAWRSPFRFEWTANRNRTDCTAQMSGLVRNSLIKFCYLQLTDMSGLSVAKPYRGFESLSSATQSELQRISARSTPKYANNARIPRLLTGKPNHRERTARGRRGDRRAFSPEGTYAVRFQKGVRRMQCDQKLRIRT